jgi:hypothetical protein
VAVLIGARMIARALDAESILDAVASGCVGTLALVCAALWLVPRRGARVPPMAPRLQLAYMIGWIALQFLDAVRSGSRAELAVMVGGGALGVVLMGCLFVYLLSRITRDQNPLAD